MVTLSRRILLGRWQEWQVVGYRWQVVGGRSDNHPEKSDRGAAFLCRSRRVEVEVSELRMGEGKRKWKKK